MESTTETARGTVTGADIARGGALPFGGDRIATMGVAPGAADVVVEGVSSVVLWADDKRAILRLEVADGHPLTMRELVRALQCGYLVSAQTACKWGPYKDMIRANVAAGCRISTGNMPHEVAYMPTWKVEMAPELPLAGYKAAMCGNGQLDVMLLIGFNAPMETRLDQAA